MTKCLAVILLPVLLFSGCASTPSGPPAWIRQTTRTVDNGYLVYIGEGQDASPERAALKAEGTAIGDLANECTFVPKGARIEDHYDSPEAGIHHSYAKIGILFEECEGAKNATDPEAIRKIANVAMTEQLKRYQDLVYSPEEPAVAEAASPPTTIEGATGGPPRFAFHPYDEPSFIIYRQQVVYLKQAVILAPPGVYVASSPATLAFVTRIQPATEQVRIYEQANPGMRAGSLTWSAVQARPGIAFPPGVSHIRSATSPLAPHPTRMRPQAPPPSEPRQERRQKRKKHRRANG